MVRQVFEKRVCEALKDVPTLEDKPEMRTAARLATNVERDPRFHLKRVRAQHTNAALLGLAGRPRADNSRGACSTPGTRYHSFRQVSNSPVLPVSSLLSTSLRRFSFSRAVHTPALSNGGRVLLTTELGCSLAQRV
eukprot:1880364-Pyramimonas_sp.AAC.1